LRFGRFSTAELETTPVRSNMAEIGNVLTQ
jgi:hypothetical protein